MTNLQISMPASINENTIVIEAPNRNKAKIALNAIRVSNLMHIVSSLLFKRFILLIESFLNLVTVF
jgi:hypothetical protein